MVYVERFMKWKLIPRFFAFPVFAVVGQALWMTQFTPESVVGWTLIPFLTYAWFCIGGLSHELIHNNLPISPGLSRFIGRIIGTVIAIPYTVYREVHMRHHAYLNTPQDIELWPYSDPNASLRFRRIFVWFDLFFGSLATPLIWSRICFSKTSEATAEQKRIMKIEYMGVAVFWISIVTLGIWLHLSGWFTFRAEHLIFAIPPTLASNVNSLRKMMEHLGTCSFDPVMGTRTVVGESFLTRAISYFDFDLAVHGPHHRYPKVDHSKLVATMKDIEIQRPGTDFPVFGSFRSALFDTFSTLFANPAVGVNAGCTDAFVNPVERNEVVGGDVDGSENPGPGQDHRGVELKN